MAEKKCDMIIQLGEAVWTETHYLPATIDLATALTTITNLTAQRSYCFSANTQFQEVRVSDIGVLGDSLVQTKALGGYGSTLPAGGPETAMLVRAELSSLHRAQLWLRGAPDDWTQWDINFDQQEWTTDYAKWADAYLDKLKTAGFGAIVKLKLGEAMSGGGGGNVTGYPVTNINGFPVDDPSAPGVALTSAMPPGTLAPGSLVVVKGARGDAKAINGTWPLISVPSGGKFPIGVPYADVLTFSPADLAKCKIYVAVFEFRTYTNFLKRFIRGKKYGRDFALPRGRARTRR